MERATYTWYPILGAFESLLSLTIDCTPPLAQRSTSLYRGMREVDYGMFVYRPRCSRGQLLKKMEHRNGIKGRAVQLKRGTKFFYKNQKKMHSKY